MKENVRILVTGCCGFIGAAVVYRLVKNNFEVTGIDNLNDYYSQTLKNERLALSGLGAGNYRFHIIDIKDQKELHELFNLNKFHIVYHFAAQAGVQYSLENPEDVMHQNINGFFNVLEMCREYKVGKLIYASSSSVYGNEHGNDYCNSPISFYAATKKCNEVMAHSYHKLHGFDCIGLRFYTVYGEMGRPDMAILKFINMIVNGKEIELYNNGENYRDYTYIDDAVLLTIQASKLNGYQIVDVGKGNPISTNELIAEIEKALGKKAKTKRVGKILGDVEITKSPSENKGVSLEEGIRKTVNWYREYTLNGKRNL